MIQKKLFYSFVGLSLVLASVEIHSGNPTGNPTGNSKCTFAGHHPASNGALEDWHTKHGPASAQNSTNIAGSLDMGEQLARDQRYQKEQKESLPKSANTRGPILVIDRHLEQKQQQVVLFTLQEYSETIYEHLESNHMKAQYFPLSNGHCLVYFSSNAKIIGYIVPINSLFVLQQSTQQVGFTITFLQQTELETSYQEHVKALWEQQEDLQTNSPIVMS